MGIRGLTTFIHNSTEYLENYQLKDSTVILDGFSLTNFLYEAHESKLSDENKTSAFGGDYDTVAKVYVDFINWLIKCNVVPVFVFDGAREERKIETIKKRTKSKIALYGRPIKTSACTPYFISDIIFDILNDMDIPFVKCHFEADPEIFVLAKLLKCPIISNDSDFYLTTVPYIPFKTINLDFESRTVSCKRYKVEKLLNHFGGLKLEFLPLVTVLLGDDFIKPDTFFRLLRIKRGTSDFNLRLSRITNWLRYQIDVNSAVDRMTRHLDQSTGQSRNIENQIRITLNNNKNEDSKYLSILLQNKNMSTYQDELKMHIIEDEKRILPQWLEDNYQKGYITSEVMTIYTQKKIFFKCQIEDYRERPYYEVSFKIVERILGLLFGNTSTYPYFGRTLRSSTGAAQGECNLRAHENNPRVSLATLNKVDMESRKSVILNLMELKNFNGVPKEWELFILVLIYWATHTRKHKSKHTNALIACAMKLMIIDKMGTVSQNEISEKIIIEGNVIEVKKEDCSSAMSAFKNYGGVCHYKHECASKRYYDIVHPYAQFQGCLSYFMMLNSLLNFPFDQCRVEHFFKGSLLYSLCVKMENFSDPEEFVILKLFDKSDSLNKVYKSIINLINKLISDSKKREHTDFTSGSEPPSKKIWKKL